jgi:hypothetical protein
MRLDFFLNKIYFRIVLLVFVWVIRGAKLEQKTIQCKAGRPILWERWKTQYTFKNISFNRDTKLKIEWSGLNDAFDEYFYQVWFYSSSVSLIHPDILGKFPNTKEIYLIDSTLNDLDKIENIENCQNITAFKLQAKDLTGIPSNTFSDCKNLESLKIGTKSLIDLPEGLLKYQENLQYLELAGKDLKLRMSPFEGLKSLAELKLRSANLIQVEENFFQSLNIRRLKYNGNRRLTLMLMCLSGGPKTSGHHRPASRFLLVDLM